MSINKERKRLIKYIDYNISEILIEDRINILNIIAEIIDKRNIYEENTGTRILYKHMSDHLLKKVQRFIIEAQKKTNIDL